MEKQPSRSSHSPWLKRILAVLLLCLIAKTGVSLYETSSLGISDLLSTNGLVEKPCDPIPKVPIDDALTKKILKDPAFVNKSVDRLSKAVQIDTTIGDTDEKIDFSKFVKFHGFLESEFASVYKYATVLKVNKFGLVFEFPGKNSTLKPVMFMGHQDTVELGDLSRWTKGPFSGEVSEGRVWGRGASDCKNLLIGLLEVADLLAQENYEPERGFLFAFGFDEESSGLQGAAHISQFLLDRYGPDSIDHIIDEGINFIMDIHGKDMVMIATAEKGLGNLVVEVTAPGGHASMPPDHTAIGVISRFLAYYEDDQYKPKLPDGHPMLDCAECVGRWGDVTLAERKALLHARHDLLAREIAIKLFNQNTMTKFAIQTSQAIDIVVGGDKENSLPNSAKAVINHRIAVGNSLETLLEKATTYGRKTANQYGCGLTINGTQVLPPTEIGNLNVTIPTFDARGPAPVTPIKDTTWNNYVGIARSLYEDYVDPAKYNSTTNPLVSTPVVTTGSTDTYHMWALSTHIYRSQPGVWDPTYNLHTIDENMLISTHLETVGFYYNYIKKATAA